MLRRILNAIRGSRQALTPPPVRRGLNLPLEPVPANGPALAEKIVEATDKVEGVRLDYSAASLQWVDQRIWHFRKEGKTFNEVGETVFLYGCYAGEVLRRNLDGQWSEPSATEQAVGFAMPGVRVAGQQFWNPIGKANVAPPMTRRPFRIRSRD